MRWFTREWATFDLSDEASHVVLREATAHHRTLVQHAPRKLQPLFLQREPQIRLEDGRFESITFTGGGTITLGLVQGVLATGYGLLKILFTGSALHGLTIEPSVAFTFPASASGVAARAQSAFRIGRARERHASTLPKRIASSWTVYVALVIDSEGKFSTTQTAWTASIGRMS